MDPNATIRELNSHYAGTGTGYPVTELMHALSNWTHEGGFRPTEKLTDKARRAMVKAGYGSTVRNLEGAN
jgi:hypothetical protein